MNTLSDHDFLRNLFWTEPEYPHCPYGHHFSKARIDSRRRPNVPRYRCKVCGKTFNIFTGTILQHTKYKPADLVRIIKGLRTGASVSALARDLHLDRSRLSHLCALVREL